MLDLKSRLIGTLVSTLLCGCVTERQTDPPQTATEQLLVAKAVDRSTEQIPLQLPGSIKVYLDTHYYDSDVLRSKYAVGRIREKLLTTGAHLVSTREDADAIVELRSAAQSIDYSNFLIGIPSFPLPIPFAGTLQFPEIALFKIDRQKGVSELTLTAYDRGSGSLIATTGVLTGTSLRSKLVILLISFNSDDVSPSAKPQSTAEAAKPERSTPLEPASNRDEPQ